MRNSPHLQLSPVLIWGSADLFQSSSQLLSLVRRSYNNFTPVEACSGCMSPVQFMFNFTATGHITPDAFMTGSQFPLRSAETPDNCLPLDSCSLCLAYLMPISCPIAGVCDVCKNCALCPLFHHSSDQFCFLSMGGIDGWYGWKHSIIIGVFRSFGVMTLQGSWMSSCLLIRSACIVFGYQAGMIMVLLPLY